MSVTQQHGVTCQDLQKALNADIIEPWYHPKVDFRTGKWLGAEVLARWFNPQYGYISPAEFIPLAEKNDLINLLTEQVFRKAAQQMAVWLRKGLLLQLSVNISACSLSGTEMFRRIVDCCSHSNVKPDMFTLEITESAPATDSDIAAGNLTWLRKLGFGLSVDDFGTGYSSLALLNRFPFTELKLDHSFISRCRYDPVSRIIIRNSLALAQQLGLRTVAEGVEDQETWWLLSKFGCDVCQGYFSGKPLPEHELEHWSQEWECYVSSTLNVDVSV